MPTSHFENLLRRTMGLNASAIGRSAIESAVRSRMKSCRLNDLAAYHALLQVSEAEMQELIEAVIVPETWFFRDRGAFSALGGMVTGKWLPANPNGGLRLLSLPCSSGEEPYSMAMALLDAGLPEGFFQIDAVDISARSLERARRGVYGGYSFRGTDLGFRDRFFKPVENDFGIADIVRRPVRFLHGNLLDPQLILEMASYDFIFCRNVLIYFDRETQYRAVRILERLLKPTGLLFTGPSESGLLLSHDFVSARLPLAFAFHRKAATPVKGLSMSNLDNYGCAGGIRCKAPGAPHGHSMQATGNAAACPPAQPERSSYLWTAPKPNKPATCAINPPAQSRFTMVKHPARPAFPAITTVKPPLAPQRTMEAATLDDISRLADQGRLQEAKQRCQEFLRVNSASVRALYLMGLLHDTDGDRQEAERHYRKVLYLDPGHQEAIVHLAFLMEQKGDADSAKQLHQRAKRVGARS